MEPYDKWRLTLSSVQLFFAPVDSLRGWAGVKSHPQATGQTKSGDSGASSRPLEKVDVIENFDVLVSLDTCVLPRTHAAASALAKLRLHATLPQFSVHLSSSSFRNILNILDNMPQAPETPGTVVPELGQRSTSRRSSLDAGVQARLAHAQSDSDHSSSDDDEIWMDADGDDEDIWMEALEFDQHDHTDIAVVPAVQRPSGPEQDQRELILCDMEIGAVLLHVCLDEEDITSAGAQSSPQDIPVDSNALTLCMRGLNARFVQRKGVAHWAGGVHALEIFDTWQQAGVAFRPLASSLLVPGGTLSDLPSSLSPAQDRSALSVETSSGVAPQLSHEGDKAAQDSDSDDSFMSAEEDFMSADEFENDSDDGSKADETTQDDRDTRQKALLDQAQIASSSSPRDRKHSSSTQSDTDLVRFEYLWYLDRSDNVSLTMKFNTLHLEWNPETIAALQRFLQPFLNSDEECDVGDDEVSTAGAYDKAPDQASEAQRNQPGEATDSPEQDARASADLEQPAKVVKYQIHFSMRSLSISCNKERERRKLLRFATTDTAFKYIKYTDETTHCSGTLGNLSGNDLTVSEDGLYKEIFGLMDESSSSLVEFSFDTYDPEALGFPGYNSLLRLNFSPMRFVYTQQLWLEVIDYLFEGMLGDAVLGQAEATQQLVLDHFRMNRNKLDVTLSCPTVVLPRHTYSRERLTASAKELKVSNVFELRAFDVKDIEKGHQESMPAEGETELMMNTLHIYLGDLDFTYFDVSDESEASMLHQKVCANVTVTRPLGEIEVKHQWQVHIPFSAVSLVMSREQYLTIRGIISENIGEEYIPREDNQCFSSHAPAVQYTYAASDEVTPYDVHVECGSLTLDVHNKENGDCFKFEVTEFEWTMDRVRSDVGSQSIRCGSIVLVDERAQSEGRQFREILRPSISEHEAGSKLIPQLFYTNVQQPNEDTDYTLVINHAHIYIVPDMVTGLGQFFGRSDEESAPTFPTADVPSESPLSEVQGAQQVTGYHTTWDIKLKSPHLIFVEDLMANDPDAIVVQCDCDFQYHSTPDDKVDMNISFEQLISFMCKGQSPPAVGTDLIVHPISATFRYSSAVIETITHSSTNICVGSAMAVTVSYQNLRLVEKISHWMLSNEDAAPSEVLAVSETQHVTLTLPEYTFESEEGLSITVLDDCGHLPVPLVKFSISMVHVGISGPPDQQKTVSTFSLSADYFRASHDQWTALMDQWDFQFAMICAQNPVTDIVLQAQNPLVVHLSDSCLRSFTESLSAWTLDGSTSTQTVLDTEIEPSIPTAAQQPGIGDNILLKYSLDFPGLRVVLSKDTPSGTSELLAWVTEGMHYSSSEKSEGRGWEVEGHVHSLVVEDIVALKRAGPAFGTLASSLTVEAISTAPPTESWAVTNSWKKRTPTGHSQSYELKVESPQDAQDHEHSTQLINFKKITRPRETQEDGMETELNIRFNTLHVEWNPDTIAALQSFFKWQDQIPTAEPVLDEAKVVADSSKSETSPSKSPPVDRPARRGRIAPSLIVNARLQSLSISCNKEREGRKLLRFAMTDTEVKYIKYTDDCIHCSGTLGNLSGNDLTISEDGLYSEILGLMDETGSSLVDFKFDTYDPEALDFPGHNSLLGLRFSPMRFVYIQQFWLEFIDYLWEGILGDAVWGKIEETQQLILEGMRVSKNKLDISLSCPTVVLPRHAYSHEKLTLVTKELKVTNWFSAATQEDLLPPGVTANSGDEVIWMNHIELELGDLDIESAADVSMLGEPVGVRLSVVRALTVDDGGPPAPMMIAGSISDFRLVCTQQQYALLLNMLFDNIWAELPPAFPECIPIVLPPADSPSEGASSLCLECTLPFTYQRRRHHCRACGRLVCRWCARQHVLEATSQRMVRICETCYVHHDGVQPGLEATSQDLKSTVSVSSELRVTKSLT
jgi:hypothetical protein